MAIAPGLGGAKVPVVVSRIDYMLTSEATIAAEDMSREGESVA